MSRKHYILIATSIIEAYARLQGPSISTYIDILVSQLCEKLKEENPCFSSEKFRAYLSQGLNNG